MNIERINELADHIEGLTWVDIGFKDDDGVRERAWRGELFSMRSWTYLDSDYRCETPACMAGHCVALFGGGAYRRNDPEYNAMRLLGLSEDQAIELFSPGGEHADFTITTDSDPRFISPARAAAQLRRVAETGEVDWSATP